MPCVCGRRDGHARSPARGGSRGEVNDGLERRLRLGGATAVNVLAMIGVGPFVTIPLLLKAMGGPPAMLGWFIGAVVALADGLVWSELGGAMPRSGGGYEYLLEAYG